MVVMEACSAGANHMPRDIQGTNKEGMDQSDQREATDLAPVDPAPVLPPNPAIPLVGQDNQKTSSNFDVWPMEMLKWRSAETLSLVVRS